jgi:histidinol-phosphate/aromatic aminotransferase/cobyric acid decarboxylase-like protein
LSRGIIVKNLGDVLHHSNCLRTTVGLPEMNMRLLSALEEVLGEEDE